jgi:hypothetical protein
MLAASFATILSSLQRALIIISWGSPEYLLMKRFFILIQPLLWFNSCLK